MKTAHVVRSAFTEAGSSTVWAEGGRLALTLADVGDNVVTLERVFAGGAETIATYTSDIDIELDVAVGRYRLVCTSYDSGTVQYCLRDFETNWKDNESSVSAARVTGSSQPTWTQFQDGVYQYAFSKTADQEVWLAFHVNHDILPGSLVYPHVHWSPSDTDTGTVRFGLEYTVGRRDGTFGANSTIYLEQAGAGTALSHQVVESDCFDAMMAPEIDSLILLHLWRDADHENDTYDNDCFILTADLHYQSTDPSASTPGKSSPFYSGY